MPSVLLPSTRRFAPVVQQGDLYRLISPYEGDNNLTSLMYVSENKEKAVLFAYRHLIRENLSQPIIRLQGLNPNAKYTIREVAPEFVNKPVKISGKTISGKMLMEEGIVMPELTNRYKSNEPLSEVRATNDWRSVVLELTEVK